MKKTSILFGLFTILSIQIVFSQSKLENKYDVKQYILDLQISNTSTVISGNVTINAREIAPDGMDTIVFELIGTIVTNSTFMVVDSVFVNGVMNVFQHNNDLIFIPLTSLIQEGQMFSAQIFYHGNAHSCYQTAYDGITTTLYAGNSHTYNLNEDMIFGSKTWFPSKQVLSDKADSVTFFITTDSTNKTGSNGLLKSKTILPNGKCKYKWVTHYPIAYYLISFVVGPYEENTHYLKLDNQTDSIFMQNLLIHDNTYYPIHLKALEKTDLIMNLYSEKFGIYPFKNEKYGNSIIGVPWAGMEHQTMCTMSLLLLDTTMTDITQFGCPIYCWGNAHEFAHHWFGDYVTCATWNNTWLNEGIGTYVEYIAIQNLETQNRADIWMNKIMNYIKTLPDGSVYIPDSQVSSWRIFSPRLTYCKGGAVMHILRHEINNDSIFFLGLRNYLHDHAYSNATTEDFKHSLETTTNINLTDFFDQWIYGEGYPIFDIGWSQKNDTLTILSDQTTSASITPLFKTHFDIKIKTSIGDTLVRLFQASNHDIFNIYIPGRVDSIEFDPKGWLIQRNSIYLGLDGIKNTPSFRVIPNPASNRITIELKSQNILKNSLISIYDIQGQQVFEKQSPEKSVNIDISNFARGVYIVKLSNSKGVEMSKFIKN